MTRGAWLRTAAVLPYAGSSAGQPGFAWVSLVIVTASHRGRGLGTQMLQHCIATLRSRSLTGLLDATPAGEKIYAAARVQARPRVAALARRTRRRLRVARTCASVGCWPAWPGSALWTRPGIRCKASDVAHELPDAPWDARLSNSGRERLRSGAFGPRRLVRGAGGGSERARCHRSHRRGYRVHPWAHFHRRPGPANADRSVARCVRFHCSASPAAHGARPRPAARRSGARVRHRRTGVRVTG